MIKLRTSEFLTLAQAHGHTTYRAQATATGLGSGTLHRLRAGAPAGSRVVTAILTTYGVDFERLFIVGDENRYKVAA